MFKKFSFLLLVGATISIMVGCASITKGQVQDVTIDSNVQGAEILINGARVGTTPYSGILARNSKTKLTLQKEGYRSKTIVLDTSIEPVFWGNILLGGGIGSTTDAVNGSMYKYTPGNIVVDLEPEVGK